MKKGWITLLVFVVAVLIVASWIIGIMNSMVKKNEEVKNAWAEINNQYLRRADLIPNLVNTVKGYAEHEKSIMETVALARSKLAGGRTISEQMEGAKQIDSVISRLLLIVENYPNLKAGENFRDMQSQLEGTENRISVARMRYNDSVRDFNAFIKYFPNRFFAKGYKEAVYYEVPEKALSVPEVNFNK